MSIISLRNWLCALVLALFGCISVVDTHERALLTTTAGVTKKTFGPGWYFRLPWNHYKTYDVRWKQHEEEIDVTTKDGLHIKSTITVVSRPNPAELYELDLDVGSSYYEQLVRPALYASVRDAGAKFDHLQASKQTGEVEAAIKAALVQRLTGHHLEIDEVALKHFDLPDEVVQAANRTAASEQLLAAKQVDLDLAQKDAELAKQQRKGKLEADGLERQMRADQDLAAAEGQLKIEQAKRKSERERQEADAEVIVMKAEAEAKAVELAAEAERKRIEATSSRLTPSYIRLQAIDALARAMSGPNTKVVVMPTGKNGLPSFFGPFLNPLGTFDTTSEPAP